MSWRLLHVGEWKTKLTLNDLRSTSVTLRTVSATTTSVVRPAAVLVDSETLSASGRPRHFRSTRHRPLPLTNSKTEDLKEKRIKKMVVIVATFMILASFVLVGASLSMSDHIDEMGKLSSFSACSLLHVIANKSRDVLFLSLELCFYVTSHATMCNSLPPWHCILQTTP